MLVNTPYPVSRFLALALTLSLLGVAPVWAAGSNPGNNSVKPGPGIEDAALNLTARDDYNRGVYLFQVAQSQNEAGNHKGQMDLLKKAIEKFEEALVKAPDLIEAQSNIGFAYLTMGNEKKAIKAFEKALALNDKHLNSLNGLATAQAQRERYAESLATFDRLTTLDPGNAEYWFNKGSIHQKSQQADAARQAYEQALKINPNHQQSWFNLGTLLENQHAFTEAKNAYEHVKAIDITSPIGLEATNRLQWIESEEKRDS